MRVLVLDSAVPLSSDPARPLRTRLVERLAAAGIEAEALVLPFSPARLGDEILVARSLRLLNADQVIALAFPALLVPHAKTVIWLQQAPHGRGGRAGAAVREAEARAFAGAARLFAATEGIAAALRDEYGRAATVLADLPDSIEMLLA